MKNVWKTISPFISSMITCVIVWVGVSYLMDTFILHEEFVLDWWDVGTGALIGLVVPFVNNWEEKRKAKKQAEKEE